MSETLNIAVLTHNPNGDWGDVRPLIEQQGYYEKWGKSINLVIGQTVLIYISSNIRQIQYIMEVTNVYDDSIDLKLVKKLSEKQSKLLSFENLKKHGLKKGTINYILDNNRQLYEYVKSVISNNAIKEKKDEKMNSVKNIILYGAPGVGKTHNYQNLISMIEDGKSQKEIFDTVSKNLHVDLENETFDSIKKDGRVEFVTFHQSYSYEDFIEGYRPDEDSDKIVRKDGIFKLIADNARKNLENSQKNIETIQEERKFEELFDLFKDYIEDEIEKNKKFDINETVYITNIENDAFRYQGNNWGNTQRMKFADIELLYNSDTYERKEIKKVNNISGLAKQHATYFSYFMKHFLDFKKKQKIDIQKIDKIDEKNFYIVIDEINRGNISKIFGELITLIEEDKRDVYEVTLPYSKEKFKVPSNLYIIATMNSTDKSIATIDIALRRRFTFLKMKPKAELIKDENAKKLFNDLNDFISHKDKGNLGEDYMLGHSYFMKIENDDDLEFIKEYKIKPLLEEYFYADEDNYTKAVAILNKENQND